MKKRMALLMALAVVVLGAIAGVGSAATHTAKATVITVTATDFHFAIGKHPVLKHGVPYVFKLVNKGAAAHNIDIVGAGKTKVIGHGATATLKVTFKKAGKFQYVCDVPRHIELGMAGYLTVK
jgi:plastocyanin